MLSLYNPNIVFNAGCLECSPLYGIANSLAGLAQEFVASVGSLMLGSGERCEFRLQSFNLLRARF